MNSELDIHELSSNGSASANPLSPDHLLALSEANDRAQKIRRAARVAGFNGWSIGGIALLSLPFAFSSITSLAIAIGLGLVAYIEFRGRRLLNQFEPTACRLLGWNQVGFLVLISAYCAWNIFASFNTTNPLANYPELRQLGILPETIGDLYLQITLALYGSLFLGSVLFQGGNALYYFSRERLVREYVNNTEPWVIELQKSTGSN
jgi:hypothetical protein